MGFAENLQKIRKEKRLSQEELAEMLDVSRQAVSKWEQGEGYPEVDKLLTLSRKLDVSLDSLMAEDIIGIENLKTNIAGEIVITSPHEGVVIKCSKIMRSRKFHSGNNSPQYALFASDGNSSSFWGAKNTFLGWYRNEDGISAEITAIYDAIANGLPSYELRYSVKTNNNLLGIKIES